jgi:hypothetical protein
MRVSYIVSMAAASLILSATTVRAEETPKIKIPEVKVDAKAQKDAEKKMNAAKKEAAGVTNAIRKNTETKMKQSKEQAAELQKEQAKKAEEMKKEQLKKTDELKKESAKGSEKGQAMREEHSKKWWKLWGEKEPAAK